MPDGRFIYTPTRDLWPAGSVDARVKLDCGKASAWIATHQPVDQITWAPGEPMIISNRLIADGGWIEHPGSTVFNLYRAPTAIPGDATKAGPWLELVRRVYPDDANRIIRWVAHRVRWPGQKINHALVLGGDEGIGKDSILHPVRDAVGSWNVQHVSPQQVLGRFNGFLKSVILQVDEAHDLGEFDRYALHERLKTYIAAPPEVLRVDEKNLREHPIPNVAGVVITTNHEDGLHLTEGTRRYAVMWSDLKKEDFKPSYWRDLYAWYEQGGTGHVAAYLRALDITGFDAKAPPPKTAGFMRMLSASRAPEDSGLADAIDALNSPAALTLSMLLGVIVDDDLRTWLKDHRNARQIPHRLRAAGYVPVINDADKHDGQWRIGGRRVTVYGRRELPERDRLAAASRLARDSRF